MSDERPRFSVDGISVVLNTAPPVYAPGGPVAFVEGLPDTITPQNILLLEQEAKSQGAVLMVVQCLTEAHKTEQLLGEQEYTFASSWYSGVPTEHNSLLKDISPSNIRAATASDVSVLLEIGERKREQYEQYSPIFWKKSPTPRQDFAGYVRSQVESDRNIALVFEYESNILGYIIAQCGNLAEGYIDDYAVDNVLTDWGTTGMELLGQASRFAKARHVASLVIVTGHADTAKRAAIEQLGFVLKKNWLVKPL